MKSTTSRPTSSAGSPAPVVAVAIDISLIQKRQRTIVARRKAIASEDTRLVEELGNLELRRLENLRAFDQVAR